MATLLLSFKRNADSSLLIHGTLTPNETQSEKEMAAHAGVCPKFGPARRAGETIEVLLDVNAIPEFTQDDIEEWCDDLFGTEDEDEPGDDEDDDEPADAEEDDEPEEAK